MASNSFKIVIAGFGWWGQQVARCLHHKPFAHILGVAEPDDRRAADIAKLGLHRWASLEEAVRDPRVEGVILTTPTSLHEEQVLMCARAGKHVFCEKPLGLTAESARRSVEACRRAGVQLGVGHERRFEPAMKELKKRLRLGDLGVVMHAEAAFSHDKLIAVPPNDWRTRSDVSPAAGMTAMGIHLTDLMISFFGRVDTVQALIASRSLGWETGDVVTVQLGFAEGMTATLSAVLHTPHFIRMHVFGSEKWIEIRNQTHPDTPGGQVRLVEAVTGQPERVTTYDWTDAVAENLKAFIDAAQGERAYPFTSEEMIHNIEVLEAIVLSSRSGETIHIANLSPEISGAAQVN